MDIWLPFSVSKGSRAAILGYVRKHEESGRRTEERNRAQLESMRE
jgi:hypothetical protein